MKGRSIAVVTLSAACFALQVSLPARAASLVMPVHAMFSKVKMVSFMLRNDTGAPLKLKAGADSMTLEAGKELKVKLAEGTQVTLAEATAKQEVGAVVARVSDALDGATLVIH